MQKAGAEAEAEADVAENIMMRKDEAIESNTCDHYRAREGGRRYPCLSKKFTSRKCNPWEFLIPTVLHQLARILNLVTKLTEARKEQLDDYTNLLEPRLLEHKESVQQLAALRGISRFAPRSE